VDGRQVDAQRHARGRGVSERKLIVRPECVRSAAVVVIALTLSLGALTSLASAQTPRGRVTWQGVRTSTLMGPECQRKAEESFVWVGEVDTTGDTRWLSRKIKWSDVHTCAKEILVREDTDGDPTTPPRRVLRPYSGRCENHGEVDMATWNGEAVRGRCHETPVGGMMSSSLLPTGWAGPKPDDQMRNGCSYNWRQVEPPGPSGHVGISTESVVRFDQVNASVQAIVDDKGTAGTFPSPGARVMLSGRSTAPTRWKFIIGSSSRMRGYATNADVDTAFFEMFNLPDLRSRYGTFDPDLIFEPPRFEPPWDRTDRWKRPYPDNGPMKWSILESKSDESNVSVDLTAMDFGAHGEVVALVRSPCGGGWVQAAELNTGAPSILIGLGRNDTDHNFIPDDHKQYAGLSATSDDDDEPVGATSGDGLTAFEEYRGFMKAKPLVTNCNSRLTLEHVRTSPKRKDLFIHATDPLLWRAAMHFKSPSGLEVHMICPQDPSGLPGPREGMEQKFAARVVNKTSGIARELVGHAGEKLTLDLPQHWLRLVNEPVTGDLGRSIRVSRDEFGPPRNVDRVAVDLVGIRESRRYQISHGSMLLYPEEARQRTYELMVLLITWHELGHSVGLQHHGDNNPPGSVVLLDQGKCLPGMVAGTVEGKPACLATMVANRGGQNSGNASCPMKYIQWDYYVPPPLEALRRAGYVEFRPEGSWSWRRPRLIQGARGGPVVPYRKVLDPPGLGSFCTSRRGTGINARPRDENHAGDATREPSCSAQLRVNDTR
jgi:hypothetical protein